MPGACRAGTGFRWWSATPQRSRRGSRCAVAPCHRTRRWLREAGRRRRRRPYRQHRDTPRSPTSTGRRRGLDIDTEFEVIELTNDAGVASTAHVDGGRPARGNRVESLGEGEFTRRDVAGDGDGPRDCLRSRLRHPHPVHLPRRSRASSDSDFARRLGGRWSSGPAQVDVVDGVAGPVTPVVPRSGCSQIRGWPNRRTSFATSPPGSFDLRGGALASTTAGDGVTETTTDDRAGADDDH